MVSDVNIFVWKWSKIAARKKFFFCADFALQNMLKPRFPMDKRLLVKGYIANFGISLDVIAFWMIFFVKKKEGFWVFLVHPTVVLVLLSASVERCFVSRMRDFF